MLSFSWLPGHCVYSTLPGHTSWWEEPQCEEGETAAREDRRGSFSTNRLLESHLVNGADCGQKKQRKFLRVPGNSFSTVHHGPIARTFSSSPSTTSFAIHSLPSAVGHQEQMFPRK
ncbi:hypothetical protein AB205_0022790 [Aquarana catesbeiana]|uniref:Uncharacterized protein n=1 Tax=Aquarana catesbeiana TaxID=8400 RepID=A0A2G9RHR2_AQUCT|nr:hypothetical protein AB205_0022790 [Aquarana catesbeiana]